MIWIQTWYQNVFDFPSSCYFTIELYFLLDGFAMLLLVQHCTTTNQVFTFFMVLKFKLDLLKIIIVFLMLLFHFINQFIVFCYFKNNLKKHWFSTWTILMNHFLFFRNTNVCSGIIIIITTWNNDVSKMFLRSSETSLFIERIHIDNWYFHVLINLHDDILIWLDTIVSSSYHIQR